MKIINSLNRIITYSFYTLFFLTPLLFTSATSELFELPKMWLVFFLTILITGSWGVLMILQSRIYIQRTPLDLPILLFLSSQIISTVFSIDPHVSLWGYYSRFNGGLLSIISYLLLYYAFVSNLNKTHVIKILKISLTSGLIVALWGIPSHFGYDPTCFVFRGSFDTSCWTAAFKPTIRIFSTLGQPAWLAAYMSILIPISIAFGIKNSNFEARNSKQTQNTKNYNLENSNSFRNSNFGLRIYFILAVFFYIALVYTDTRGGYIGFWIANTVFWSLLYFKKLLSSENFKKYFLIFNISFLLFNFLQGLPISQLEKFTLPEIVKNAQHIEVNEPAINSASTPPVQALGGTDSGKIRLFVWRGAIDAWLEKPIIGQGVETFAFAYYKHKPIGHNLTSEWDYLYNKAHNEYLNYLATTGILGLGSYLAIIGTFFFIIIKQLRSQNIIVKNESQKSKVENSENSLEIGNWKLEIGLLSAYISILISNFFGFSVVVINTYFFLIPAFVLVLTGSINTNKIFAFPKNQPNHFKKLTSKQWYFLTVVIIVISYLLFVMTSSLRADISYANGQTLNQVGRYQEANPFLVKAISLFPYEPVYRDELSTNMGTLAAALYIQNEVSNASKLKEQAIILSDSVVGQHPNNIVFWKNRVRLFYALAQGDSDNEDEYLDKAYQAVQKSEALAPTDAKIAYNLGILNGQRGQIKEAIIALEEAIRLKPNYRDAYFALGLYYDEAGNPEKATESLNYILENLDPNDEQTKETLESLGK